jgi:hypothetical protein
VLRCRIWPSSSRWSKLRAALAVRHRAREVEVEVAVSFRQSIQK